MSGQRLEDQRPITSCNSMADKSQSDTRRDEIATTPVATPLAATTASVTRCE